MKNEKGSEIPQFLIDAANDLASVVESMRQVTPPTSNPVVPVATTRKPTFYPCVEPATASSTPLEFESSLEDLETQSTDGDEPKEFQQLVFPCLFKNIMKSDEGGYLLTFEVPEDSRHDVAELLKKPRKVLHIVVVEQED